MIEKLAVIVSLSTANSYFVSAAVVAVVAYTARAWENRIAKLFTWSMCAVLLPLCLYAGIEDYLSARKMNDIGNIVRCSGVGRIDNRIAMLYG